MAWALTTRARRARGRQPSGATEQQRALLGDVLDRQRFSIAHQPIQQLEDGRTVGFEALTRLHDGTRPAHLFDAARAAGLTQRVELLTAGAACRDLPLLPGDPFLTLNLSPVSFDPSHLAHAIAGTPMDRVVLELTEYDDPADCPKFLSAVDHWRSQGARLAVDDTGSGAAGLRRLVTLQPDIIKIDRGLVTDVHAHRGRSAVVAALVTFAERTDAITIAEGVETDADLAALISLGVTHAQGYLLGHPRTARAMSAWDHRRTPAELLH